MHFMQFMHSVHFVHFMHKILALNFFNFKSLWYPKSYDIENFWISKTLGSQIIFNLKKKILENCFNLKNLTQLCTNVVLVPIKIQIEIAEIWQKVSNS